jgi:fatty-acid desaturase
MEKMWILQQLPLALILYLIGGVEWVLWGTCLRVAISVTGHWLIGYFAHNSGHRLWHVNGAGVQCYIKFCGLITMGECWHNHHAFPGSAKLGLEKGQFDPGWWVLILLSKIGLVKNLKLVTDLEEQQELVPYHQKTEEQP